MDTTQGLAMGSLLTALTAITGYIIRWNHKRVRSTCCNKPCVTSIDVEDTTPTTVVAEVKEEESTTK
jgi:hypothetical protein